MGRLTAGAGCDGPAYGSAASIPDVRRLPASALVRATGPALPARVREDWLDPNRRSVLLARISIVTSLVMAVAKIGVAVVATASLFWLTNAAFSVGPSAI